MAYLFLSILFFRATPGKNFVRGTSVTNRRIHFSARTKILQVRLTRCQTTNAKIFIPCWNKSAALCVPIGRFSSYLSFSRLPRQTGWGRDSIRSSIDFKLFRLFVPPERTVSSWLKRPSPFDSLWNLVYLLRAEMLGSEGYLISYDVRARVAHTNRAKFAG